MKNRDEIIRGLEGVKAESGRVLHEGFAWMAGVIDDAIAELKRDPSGEIEAEFRFTTPDGYTKKYPVSPVSVTEDEKNHVRIRTYSMNIIEYMSPVKSEEAEL